MRGAFIRAVPRQEPESRPAMEIDYARAGAALARAVTRLQVAGRGQ